MSGTHYLEERSVLAARRKAMSDIPLPENMEYVGDSLDVDDLSECMIANGWDEEEVWDLSKFSAMELVKMIDTRVAAGFEIIPDNPYTTTRLKEFLLDYYDIEYGSTGNVEGQSKDTSAKMCFVVIYSSGEGAPVVSTFKTEKGAKDYISKRVKLIIKHLKVRWLQPQIFAQDNGDINVCVPGTSISGTWSLIKSAIED